MTRSLTLLTLAAAAVAATALAGVSHAKSPSSALGASGGPSKQKICKHTYNPDGTRCTFCYYTTQPGSGSTVCIKIKTKSGQQSSSPKRAIRM